MESMRRAIDEGCFGERRRAFLDRYRAVGG
jgi:hypothetical protein